MKHIFFDNQGAANIGHLAIGGNGGFVIGDIINFAGNAAINLGGNAGAKILNIGGAVAMGGANLGIIHLAPPIDPIVQGAIITISNPATTSVDLSHLQISDYQLQQICPHLSINPNIEFVDFSLNQITTTGLQSFITTPHTIVSTNFSACPIDIAPLILVEQSIYQSPLINCTIGDGFNLLAPRQEKATVIMNALYKMLNHFDLNSAQERENLIKFISSPRAQKALKWLSQNSEELGLKSVVGEEFVLLLNRLANENMFYLKGVCKGFTEESLLSTLPPESLSEILSYLKFNDILPSTASLGENVEVLGSFSLEEGDDGLYS